MTTIDPPSQTNPERTSRSQPMNWSRTLTVTRTDLKQLMQARDFWGPMVILGALFFVVLPTILLTLITQIGSVRLVSEISETLDVLPIETQEQLQGTSPEGKTGYALAVFLFAPVAVVVPLTISTAVGAATIVGERERGTGEFLANSPAGVREIYIGKLLASLIPGYFTTAVGFGLYSIVVNLTVGPEVGGWFFPTAQWWVMILWVLPPFLAICLSLVLRLSAKVQSTAAAQQASGLISLPLIMIAYGQATGVLLGAGWVPLALGAVAWSIALFSLSRGVKSLTRSRLLGVAGST